MTALPDFNLTCLRDPLPKPGRGSPCEGTHRGETEPAGQRSRHAVLHLTVLQRARACTRRTQGLHQSGHVRSSDGPIHRRLERNQCFTWGQLEMFNCMPLVNFLNLMIKNDDENVSSFSTVRRLMASSPTLRRRWSWSHVLGKPCAYLPHQKYLKVFLYL